MEYKEDGAGKRERRLHKRFWCNPLQALILRFQHSYVLCRAICWNYLQQLQPPYPATPGHIIQLRILCMRSARPSTKTAPQKFTTSPTSQTPQVNSGMIAAILIRRRDPHSKHVPLASAVPEPAKEEGKKKK